MLVEKLVRDVYPNLLPYKMQLADLTVEDMKKELGKSTIYKLSFNESPLGPSSKAKEAMKEAVEHLNLYPSSTGDALQEKLASKEGVTKENIILSNGADEMIVLIAQAFLNPKDEVIIPKVTFVQYLASTQLAGATPIFTPMKDDLGIDLDAILESITPKSKLIFLCNPNNPTGKGIPQVELEAFFAKLPDHVLVVMDEAYHEYGESDEYASSINFVKQNKPVIVVRTFSKVYALAAVRIGYGIASEEVIDAIHHVRPPFNVNSVAQAGALASLEDQEHLNKAIDINKEGKKSLYEAFDKLGISYIKTNGNFVYVDTERNSKEVFQVLANQGVIVRDLSGYGLTTSLRISIGDKEAVQAFIKAFTEIILNKQTIGVV